MELIYSSFGTLVAFGIFIAFPIYLIIRLFRKSPNKPKRFVKNNNFSLKDEDKNSNGTNASIGLILNKIIHFFIKVFKSNPNATSVNLDTNSNQYNKKIIITQPTSSYSDRWEFDGKTLTKPTGSYSERWEFDGKTLSQPAGSYSNRWEFDGHIPIPVISKVAGII
jgi:hypothetical protein